MGGGGELLRKKRLWKREGGGGEKPLRVPGCLKRYVAVGPDPDVQRSGDEGALHAAHH